MHEQMKRLYYSAEQIKGITGQSDVARAMNASPQTLNNWEARGMSKAGMIKAQEVFGCSATWLDTGEGEMRRAELAAQFGRPVAIADPENPDLIQIQKVKLKLSAGIMGFHTEPDRREGGIATVPRRWVEKNEYIPDRLLAVEVKGESMEPALYAGDTVIVNTADTKPQDGGVYAVNYEGEAVIKRLVRDHGMWWLSSDHFDQRKYSRKRCEGDMCIIVGRVVRKESERI
jgi:phage repressor protein C with HTH and peptisase S24 domain